MGLQTEERAKKDTFKHNVQRGKRYFLKKVTEILVDKQQQQEETEFTIVSLDESFVFYDSLIRGVCWIEEDNRPIVPSNRLAQTIVASFTYGFAARNKRKTVMDGRRRKKRTTEGLHDPYHLHH